jgi:hypothetical protein
MTPMVIAECYRNEPSGMCDVCGSLATSTLHGKDRSESIPFSLSYLVEPPLITVKRTTSEKIKSVPQIRAPAVAERNQHDITERSRRDLCGISVRKAAAARA